MVLGGFILGLLDTVLYCAIIIFIAWCIVWAFGFFGVTIDGAVLYWGKIIVALLCIIAIVSFLLSLLGYSGVYSPRIFRSAVFLLPAYYAKLQWRLS